MRAGSAHGSSPPLRLVLRDLVIAALVALAWWLDARARGAAAIAVGLVTGVVTAYAGFLAHEWGHLAAALASGSTVSYPRGLFSKLLFHFDSGENTRRQFFWMSAGGYLASILGVALIAALAPRRLSGLVALGLASLGVLATFVLEVPITLRVLRGADLPAGEAYRPFEE